MASKHGLIQIQNDCRQQTKHDWKCEFVVGRVKNTGKRRKCRLPVISAFPTMFSKGLSVNVMKTRDCLVKGEVLLKIK